MLTHERVRVSLAELEERWSLDDLLSAHLAIDVHDELAEKVAEEQRQRHEAAQRRGGRGR